jgi:hypothetical protein
VAAASGCSPVERRRRPNGRAEQEHVRAGDEDQREQHDRIAEQGTDERDRAQAGHVPLRQAGDARGIAARAEHLLEDEARQPERDQVDAEAEVDSGRP